jgi:hypothetical protein
MTVFLLVERWSNEDGVHVIGAFSSPERARRAQDEEFEMRAAADAERGATSARRLEVYREVLRIEELELDVFSRKSEDPR